MRFNILIQYLCPQRALSRFAGWVSSIRWPWLKNRIIHRFIRKYGVDMSIALEENPEAYTNFNTFFTRYLKPTARPIVQAPDQIASPADGCISQIGRIRRTALFQAKGFDFNLTALLGGNEENARAFINGHFATIYLSPKDYHRVHMPLTGTLTQTIYIPGDLFSVNQYTTTAVPNLFARNERLVCLFDTEAGPMAIILVGAMLVSGIETVWSEYPNRVFQHSYPKNVRLERGAEMGHFKMGSTVIVLFAEQGMEWRPMLQENSTIQMGELLGTLTKKG